MLLHPANSRESGANRNEPVVLQRVMIRDEDRKKSVIWTFSSSCSEEGEAPWKPC
jgi:hypothetical protein